MGCASRRLAAPVAPAGADADADPRWDDEGFNSWADEVRLQWLLVRYLRELQRAGEVLPAAQRVPRPACHVGAPPSGAELYSVIHSWLTRSHPDPWGDRLADLVELLKDAEDSDLVMIDFCSRPVIGFSAAGDGTFTPVDDLDLKTDSRVRATICLDGTPAVTDLTVEQERRRLAFERGCSRHAWPVTYSGLRTVVLHRLPERTEPFRRTKLHERVWTTADLMLAAYCQRIVNSADPEVKEHFSPAMLTNPVQRLRDGYRSGLLKLNRESDLEGIAIPGLLHSMARMVPVSEDHSGFRAFCINSRMGWIKVSFVRRFVLTLEQGKVAVLFPRRQELPRGTFYEGMPPAGRRRFVVSHGWACEHHPTPSAERIKRLELALRTAGAHDADAVFLDYASLFQRSHPALSAALGVPPQRERTAEEGKCFRAALFEMSRMYAYGGCEVLVLPQLEHWQTFPGGTAPSREFSDVKKRNCERSAQWGWINDVPYQNRGWCAAEFSCALKANIIANLADPDVQRVLKARPQDWPKTVADYNAMMEDPEIEFTAKGDRDYVAYLFFKMSFDLRGISQQRSEAHK